MAELRDDNANDDYPNLRDPRENPFGYFSYSNAPAPFGGGIGVFSWFASAQEAAEHLSTELSDHWLRRLDDSSRRSTIEAVHDALSDAATGKRTTADVLASINELLKGFVQLEWWGTLQELRRSDHEFPRKVRAALRDEDQPEDEPPIAEEELAAFVEMLSQYGF